MPHTIVARALRRSLALALIACAGGATRAAAAPATPPDASESGPLFAFTAADLVAYERGIAQEAALVRAARERGRAAKTPAERGAAAQGEWADATIAGGAAAAGLPVARYRKVREAVHHVLQTLDFQGKIEGPQEVDPSSASPAMRQRLTGDAFGGLVPASASALRARLDEVARAYVGYMNLTALHG